MIRKGAFRNTVMFLMRYHSASFELEHINGVIIFLNKDALDELLMLCVPICDHFCFAKASHSSVDLVFIFWTLWPRHMRSNLTPSIASDSMIL